MGAPATATTTIENTHALPRRKDAQRHDRMFSAGGDDAYLCSLINCYPGSRTARGQDVLTHMPLSAQAMRLADDAVMGFGVAGAASLQFPGQARRLHAALQSQRWPS
jgi:hypothetical protein